MNETHVTIRGNTTEEPRTKTTAKGEPMTLVRVASTPWRWDPEQRTYVDGTTNFVTVVAFRQLATHLAKSVHKGDPVIVHGELQVSQWDQPDGRKGTNVEVRAFSVGHDLSRGVAAFSRSNGGDHSRSGPPAAATNAEGSSGGWGSPGPTGGNGQAGAASGGWGSPGTAVGSAQTGAAGGGSGVDPSRADTDDYVVTSI
ncbi:single-stranded DNA-binding protein [Mobilicoccus sp.]|uniref:single-stranded DNA-binding protein n=1 Tax=Mobilicoccus sp. TaxID=2034349 RepID=UPI00289FFC72|nr:single-stranded DNA-binding protein [Mobilicoccus sp.]